MVREIISIDVGGAGINSGSRIWEQYNLQHNIDNQGNGNYAKGKDGWRDYSILSFYREYEEKQFKPRSLIIDSDSSTIDGIKGSQHKALFDPQLMISHDDNQSAANFANGYYVIGKDMIDKVNDALHKLVEECDNVQGFMINHSAGGGAGSGLGALILERLAIDYRKESIMQFGVYTDSDSQNAVQTYNTLLSLHWDLEHCDLSLVFDNRQLQNICKHRLLIEAPSYDNINGIIARCVSSMTVPLRFDRVDDRITTMENIQYV